MPNFFEFSPSDKDYEQLLLLDKLIERFEHELVEFKEANKDYDKDKFGSYISAISNEANLKGQQFGWFICGVRNKDKQVVGSTFREKANGLDKLRQEVGAETNGLTFSEAIEVFPVVNGESKRVVMFKIPASAAGIPTSWKGHYYARNGESLAPLSMDKQDAIRAQSNKDWSKRIVEGATIDCLDKEAIQVARANYIEKMRRPHIEEEVAQMSDEAFLSSQKLLINGTPTNAAMILLGKAECDYLMDAPPCIMWRLFAANGDDKDYAIFKIPFLLVVDKIFAKIRNLTYRYMPNQLTLFPTETQQYDPWLLRELLNNCIAHMDYTLGGRIYVNEFEESKIKLTNPGSFLPGTVVPVLEPSYNPPFYRNQLLTDAMVNFHMIDTATSGIRKVFRIQRDKYFPLPDYQVSNPQQTEVIIYGKVLNEDYSRILFDRSDIDLNTVYLIDQVQKRQPISRDAVKHLRSLSLIEGTRGNFYLSASIAEALDEKAQYIKNRGMGDQYYQDLIVEFLKKYKTASKREIEALLFDAFPAILTPQQKEYKVGNLLRRLRKNGVIEAVGTAKRSSQWQLITHDK